MKKLLLFLLFLPDPGKSQNPDSLNQVLQKLSQTDTSRVNTLLAIAYQEWINGADSLAKVYCLEAIELSKKQAFINGEANARFQIARIEMDRLEDTRGAFAHLDTAETMAAKADKRTLLGIAKFRRAQLISSVDISEQGPIDSLLNEALTIFIDEKARYWESLVYAEQATMVSLSGNFARSIDLMLKTRKIQEALGDEKALRATLPNLGVMYLQVEMYKEALECFEKAEKIATKNKDSRILAFLANQKGEIYKSQNQLKKALESYKEAARFYEQTQTTQFLTSAYARISDLYFKLGQYDLAMRFNQKADSTFRSSSSESDVYHYVYINYGNLYLHQKDYQKVISYAEAGLKAIHTPHSLTFEESRYHQLLSEAYRQKGNYKQAYEHLLQHKVASDSLLSDESKRDILTATRTYEFEKMKSEKDLQIQDSENKRLIQLRNHLILALIAGSLVIAYVLWANRRLKKYNTALIDKNREIEMALDRGQKIERRRVASELHDNLNTKLAALRWSLESMNTENWEPVNQQLHKKLLSMAADAYKDVRLISHNMLPAELEAEGLSAAFRQLLRKLNELGDIRFRFEESETPFRLTKNQEHQLYNIALEAINNVLKHAEATEVSVILKRDDRTVKLILSDNGIGMNMDSKTEGMGLHNLTNRAESIGAKTSISSAPGRGTSITVVLPLQQPNTNN